MQKTSTLRFLKDHENYKAGSIHEVEAAFGARLIISKVAEMASKSPEPEEIETASTRPRTKRKKPNDDSSATG